MALYCILMDRQYILIDTPLSSLEDNKKGGSAIHNRGFEWPT
jgi:hypothetical protein